MSGEERRAAPRLLLQHPVTVTTVEGEVQARSEDLSRMGARLRVPCAALGFPPSLNLATTAENVRGALAEAVALAVGHDVLPAVVERVAAIARIGLPLDAPASVELGLRFERPLADAELASLGIRLPPLATPIEVPAEEPTAAVPSGFGAAAKKPCRAYLTSTGPDAPPSLLCHSDQLTREAVRVRMPREGGVGLSVADATVDFAQRFGTRLVLKLVEVHKHLWTGPVRLCSVDLPRERPEDMLLTFAFERRLRPAELRRLGLDRGAA